MKIARFLSLALTVSLSLGASGTRAAQKKEKKSPDAEETTAADDVDDEEKYEDDDEADPSADVTVKSVTLARDAGDTFQTITNFTTADTYGALVQLSAPKEGTRVKCIWSAIDAGPDLKNKKIFEKEVVITPAILKGAKNPSRIDFTLEHDNPYPVGDYKAEIYLNDQLVQTAKFKILQP